MLSCRALYKIDSAGCTFPIEPGISYELVILQQPLSFLVRAVRINRRWKQRRGKRVDFPRFRDHPFGKTIVAVAARQISAAVQNLFRAGAS